MTAQIKLTEGAFRGLSFARMEQRITQRGEIDIWRPVIDDEDHPGKGIEIRVELRPREGADRGSTLSWHSLKLTGANGESVKILGEKNRPLDPEMSEVIAWEIVEADDLVIDYMEGRSAHCGENGRVSPPGTLIRHEISTDRDITPVPC